jgi:hypothetical protein
MSWLQSACYCDAPSGGFKKPGSFRLLLIGVRADLLMSHFVSSEIPGRPTKSGVDRAFSAPRDIRKPPCVARPKQAESSFSPRSLAKSLRPRYISAEAYDIQGFSGNAELRYEPGRFIYKTPESRKAPK